MLSAKWRPSFFGLNVLMFYFYSACTYNLGHIRKLTTPGKTRCKLWKFQFIKFTCFLANMMDTNTLQGIWELNQYKDVVLPV